MLAAIGAPSLTTIPLIIDEFLILTTESVFLGAHEASANNIDTISNRHIIFPFLDGRLYGVGDK